VLLLVLLDRDVAAGVDASICRRATVSAFAEDRPGAERASARPLSNGRTHMSEVPRCGVAPPRWSSSAVRRHPRRRSCRPYVGRRRHRLAARLFRVLSRAATRSRTTTAAAPAGKAVAALRCCVRMARPRKPAWMLVPLSLGGIELERLSSACFARAAAASRHVLLRSEDPRPSSTIGAHPGIAPIARGFVAREVREPGDSATARGEQAQRGLVAAVTSERSCFDTQAAVRRFAVVRSRAG
jgi:hypothetical protein